MNRSVRIIDIAGDLYNIKQLNGNTAKNRKMIRDLYTIGIQTFDKFQEIYAANDEDVALIEKYFKHGYDEKKLNVDDNDKEKLIQILTNGLEYYKNDIEIIEKLNKLKNSPSSVMDYIVIKKYNNIAELIDKIRNTIPAYSYKPIEEDKMHEILVYVAWFLLHSKNKRPESLNKLITDIDNKTISIQDIVDGIKDLKELNKSDSTTKMNTRKNYSKYIAPFNVMSKNNTYRAGIKKMRANAIKGGSNNKYSNSFSNFLYLHRYLNQ